MKKKTIPYDLHLADLFAGGGGFSTGIAEACRQLGKRPDLIAINHWARAVETHKLNHPWARHLCTGLESVNPTDVAPGRLDLLAASPECTDHSNARGGKPCNDQSRSSAWLILKWLQEIYVDAILIENVQEFTDWGPLGANGRPLKSMRGQLFDQFISSLKSLGYNVDWRVLNAANFGGATTRERLFIMARRGRNKRLLWPDTSHAKLGHLQAEMFGDQKKRWRPAREIIDWTLPSQSIFTRKRPLADTTMERIAAGLRKFGGKAAEPFLIVLRQHMGARSLNDPIPTLTAGGNHFGLCEPFIAELRGGKFANSVNDPLSTVTTKGAHHALVEPFLFNMQRGQDPILDPNNPMPTITASSNDYGLVEPFVLSMEHGDQRFNHGDTKKGNQRVYDIGQPMPTITTVDAWGVVEPYIITAGGPEGQGRHPKDLNNPLPTVLTDDRHALIQPMIVEYHGSHSGRKDGARRVRSVDDTLPTQTTENRFGLLQPFIVSYYGTQNMSTVEQPLPTCTTKARFGLVQFGDGLYLDIHFRMLTWRELSNAMGFPSNYQFTGNRSDKVRMIGNSVEVNTATALAMSALGA